MEVYRKVNKVGETYRIMNDVPDYLIGEPRGNYSVEKRCDICGCIVWKRVGPYFDTLLAAEMYLCSLV